MKPLTEEQLRQRAMSACHVQVGDEMKTDKEILEEAPEGATHVDIDGDYCKMKGKHSYYYAREEKWEYFELAIGMRSLADMKRIVEQQERIKEIEQKLERDSAVYEKIIKEQRDTINLLTPNNESATKQLQKRDLEQKAEGVIDAATDLASPYGAIPVDTLHEYGKQLYKKARKL